jgi:hypothetical protein
MALLSTCPVLPVQGKWERMRLATCDEQEGGDGNCEIWLELVYGNRREVEKPRHRLDVKKIVLRKRSPYALTRAFHLFLS